MAVLLSFFVSKMYHLDSDTPFLRRRHSHKVAPVGQRLMKSKKRYHGLEAGHPISTSLLSREITQSRARASQECHAK